jgi:hypothetical protein
MDTHTMAKSLILCSPNLNSNPNPNAQINIWDVDIEIMIDYVMENMDNSRNSQYQNGC